MIGLIVRIYVLLLLLNAIVGGVAYLLFKIFFDHENEVGLFDFYWFAFLFDVLHFIVFALILVVSSLIAVLIVSCTSSVFRLIAYLNRRSVINFEVIEPEKFVVSITGIQFVIAQFVMILAAFFLQWKHIADPERVLAYILVSLNTIAFVIAIFLQVNVDVNIRNSVYRLRNTILPYIVITLPGLIVCFYFATWVVPIFIEYFKQTNGISSYSPTEVVAQTPLGINISFFKLLSSGMWNLGISVILLWVGTIIFLKDFRLLFFTLLVIFAPWITGELSGNIINIFSGSMSNALPYVPDPIISLMLVLIVGYFYTLINSFFLKKVECQDCSVFISVEDEFCKNCGAKIDPTKPNKKAEYDKAIDYFKLALASDLKTFGEDHLDVAIDRNNLGLAWYSEGEVEKAIGYFEQALATFNSRLGSEHPSTLTVSANLKQAKSEKQLAK